MLIDGVVLIIGMLDIDVGLIDLVGLFGYVWLSYFGYIFEVKIYIKLINLVFILVVLLLYMDLLLEDFVFGIQYLYCWVNFVDGGDSIFVDGLVVVEDFWKVYLEDFRLLVEMDIFYYCEYEIFDMCVCQYVIELDEYGNIFGVMISQYYEDIFDLL